MLLTGVMFSTASLNPVKSASPQTTTIDESPRPFNTGLADFTRSSPTLRVPFGYTSTEENTSRTSGSAAWLPNSLSKSKRLGAHSCTCMYRKPVCIAFVNFTNCFSLPGKWHCRLPTKSHPQGVGHLPKKTYET